MELQTIHAQQALRVVYEIVKRAPKNCPSKAVALGASALLVVASAVMARMAISSAEEAEHVREEELCRSCSIRARCKQSLVQ